MNQKEKIEVIKKVIADYFKKQPESITSVRKNDPDFIMRWLCCYFLKFELGLKLREIAAVVYNTNDPSNIPGYLKKLNFKIMTERKIRNAVSEIGNTIEKQLNSVIV